jgi:type II secretion system protein N
MAPSIHLGRRARLALKIAGFVVLGLVAFVIALQMTFDYRRVVDKYFVEGLAASYDVKIGSVERGFMPGTFTMNKVTMYSRVTKAEEIPQVIKFESIEVDVGIFGLIGGSLSAEFEGSIGKGTLAGTVDFAFDGKSFTINATGSRINGDAIPQLKEYIGLPLLGKIDLGLGLTVAGNDYRKANGTFRIGCPKGCTLGDDKTKLKLRVKDQRSSVMMGDGLEWGHVDIDKLDGRVELKGGKMSVTKWDFQSRDAELHVELEMKLGKKFKESELVGGCFRYKALPALQTREAKTANAVTLIGGILGPDQLFHVKLECKGGGTKCALSNIKARGKVCSGEGADTGDVATTSKSSKNPALAPVTTGSGVVGSGSAAAAGVEPGADISPVPVFPDAAPAELPATGSGSNGSNGHGGNGSGSAGSGSANGFAPEGGPQLVPGPPSGERIENLRAPQPADPQPQPESAEPPVETPPPVGGVKENE